MDLHKLSAGDREEFVDAMARSRSLHGAWISAPTTAAEFDALFRRTEDDSFVSLVIRVREDGRLSNT